MAIHDGYSAALIPSRPSNRAGLLALRISFAINAAFWGPLIYWHWKNDSLYLAVGRSALFVAIMAAVHFIGYRLWRQQFVQDRGSGNESPSRPLSPAYGPPTKPGLLQQGVVLILAVLALDMGQTICEAATAVAAYWLAYGIIIARRPASPTRNDLFLIRYGFLLMFASAVAALPFVGRALGRW